VGPGQPFDLQLQVDPGTVPRNALALSFTIYQALGTRSALEQTMSGTAATPVLDQAGQLALTSMSNSNTLAVDFPVVADGTSSPGAGSGSVPTINLECGPGNCEGVYPVTIDLLDTASGSTLASLTTYLVFTSPPAGTERVQFAWVIPVELATSSPLAASTVAALHESLAAIADSASPVTLAPQPATVEALVDTTSDRRRAAPVLQDLQELSTSPLRQTLVGPYVGVDPTALVDNGLGSELTQQTQRGSQVLAEAGIRSTGGTWLAEGALDQSTLAALSALGDTQLVIPPSAVVSRLEPLSPTQPFPVNPRTTTGGVSRSTTTTTGLGGTSGQPFAMFDDSQLAGELQGATGPDPALAAARVLADLSMIYFEDPNGGVIRGTVAVSPETTPPDPAFVSALLGALASSPIIQPVTLDTLFSTVPSENSTPRRFVTVSGLTSGLPARSIRSDRNQLTAFATAISGPAATTTLHQLNDDILAGESDALRPSQQQSALNKANDAFQKQLGLLTLPTAHSITLTSRTARVPFTVLSSAPYPVSGILHVSSGGLEFLPGDKDSDSLPILLNHPTNATYLELEARTSGSFSVAVSITTTNGKLTLVHGQLTVRSTASSAVAVVLSAIALLVLLVWWARTWRANRRQNPARRPGAARGTP
jgi:hypothetical protein